MNRTPTRLKRRSHRLLVALMPLVVLASLLPDRALAFDQPRYGYAKRSQLYHGLKVYVSTRFPNGQPDLTDTTDLPYYFHSLHSLRGARQ